MGKWFNLFLILIGAAAVYVGFFTSFLAGNVGLYVGGGGGVFILLVLIFWWLGRRKRKMAYAPAGRWKPRPGDAREMPALTTGRMRRIEARREREREKLRNAEVMEMRALKDPKMGTT
ncbi:MAG TPA: hypothetical protein ENH99_00990 [Candidatus Pacearchaeota archaeon]|nr:hypothetical protein [Candidatus Pacearchaeota archaeon]